MRERHDSARGDRRAAFTLVELLIVITVVALLLALMLPALGNAKESGRTTRCLSLLRQWATLYGIYGNDYAELLPPAVDRENPDPLTNAFWYHWQLIQRGGYYGEEYPTLVSSKQLEMNWCPSDDELRWSPDNTGTTVLGGGTLPENPWAPGIFNYAPKGSTFGQNPTLKSAWAPAPGNPGGATRRINEGVYWRIRDFKCAPSVVPFLGDSRSWISSWGSSPGYMFTPYYGWAPRHGGGTFYDAKGSTNLLFGDGHAENRHGSRINPNWAPWVPISWDNVLPNQSFGVVWYFAGYQDVGFTN